MSSYMHLVKNGAVHNPQETVMATEPQVRMLYKLSEKLHIPLDKDPAEFTKEEATLLLTEFEAIEAGQRPQAPQPANFRNGEAVTLGLATKLVWHWFLDNRINPFEHKADFSIAVKELYEMIKEIKA